MSKIVWRCKEDKFEGAIFPEGTGMTDLKVAGTETILFKGLRSPA